jgi:hypothetical protein
MLIPQESGASENKRMNVTPDPNDPDGIYFVNFNQDFR